MILHDTDEKPLILIVDDNPTNIDLLVDALKENYRLGIAKTARHHVRMGADSGALPRTGIAGIFQAAIERSQGGRVTGNWLWRIWR